MGGTDKGLLELDGEPLVAHVVRRFASQVASVLISANRHPERYAGYGADVLADTLPDYPGPLAGILSGLRAARTPWLAVVPCDSPFLPADLVTRLAAALPAARGIAVARAAGETQPVFALIPVALARSLDEFLARHERKIMGWYNEHPLGVADCEDVADSFMNVNTPAELAAAHARLHHA